MSRKKNIDLRLYITLIYLLCVNINFGQNRIIYETNNEEVKTFIYSYYTSLDNNSNSILLDKTKLYLPYMNLIGKNITVYYDKLHLKKATEIDFDTLNLKYEIIHYSIKGDVVLKYSTYYLKKDTYIGINPSSPYDYYFKVSLWKLIELCEFNNNSLISNLKSSNVVDDGSRQTTGQLSSMSSRIICKFIKDDGKTEFNTTMYVSNTNEFELSHYIEMEYYSTNKIKSVTIYTPYFYIDSEANDFMSHRIIQFFYDINGCLVKF